MNHSKDPKDVVGITQNEKEKLKKRLQKLEEKLEDETWEDDTLQAIKGAVEGVPLEGLERNLWENLKTYINEDSVRDLILDVLANNNPNIYKMIGVKVPPKCHEFLNKISRQYGIKVKHSIKRHYGPDDWRYITSEARKGGKYQGARLHSKILKWNGDSCVITSNPPDTIKLANHFIKNLSDKFEGFDKRKSKILLQELDELRDSIEKLREKITSHM